MEEKESLTKKEKIIYVVWMFILTFAFYFFPIHILKGYDLVEPIPIWITLYFCFILSISLFLSKHLTKIVSRYL